MAGVFTHASASPSSTVSLSGLESGPGVHALSTLNDHQTGESIDTLIALATQHDALLMLAVSSPAEVERAKPIVARALDEHVDLFLEGPAELVAALQPKGIHIWAPGERLFVSNRSVQRGLFVMAFDHSVSDAQLRAHLIDARGEIAHEIAPNRARRSVADMHRDATREVPVPSPGSFDIPGLSAKTPSEVCIAIRNALVEKIGANGITDAQADKAVNRVCQYGTLGEFRAQPADTAYQASDDPEIVLNMRQEWLLLISEDKSRPQGSSAYFWIRTLGDNAGSGFTRADGSAGYAYNNRTTDMFRIMNPLIHSGWGPLDNMSLDLDDRPSPELFACEANPQTVRSVSTAGFEAPPLRCPEAPKLLSVLPADSFDDTVTISHATSWNIGASYTQNASLSAVGPSVGWSMSLSVGRTSTDTATTTLRMVHTSTNANTTMYRTTEWSPNWEAMAKWVEAQNLSRGAFVSLGHATPLAATLNPAWSMVWQLPLEPNLGRKTLYTSVMQARNQRCLYDANHATCTKSKTLDTGYWTRNSSVIVSLDDLEPPAPAPDAHAPARPHP